MSEDRIVTLGLLALGVVAFTLGLLTVLGVL